MLTLPKYSVLEMRIESTVWLKRRSEMPVFRGALGLARDRLKTSTPEVKIWRPAPLALRPPLSLR